MRVAAVTVVVLLLLPLVGPAAAAVRAAPVVAVEWDRLGELAANTLVLTAVACVVAVPSGLLTALALGRVWFPGRRFARVVVAAALFVPLPVVAVAWQILLGPWWRPLGLAPGEVVWQPWAKGLLPAGLIHGAAGWPWVAVITSLALRRIDRELHDAAVVEGGPAAVLRAVLLPQLLLGAAAGAAWVGVQCLTEIAVTDMVMVRTFAEEIYTQQVIASDGIGATLAVTALPWLTLVGLAAMILRRHLAQLAEPGSDTTAVPTTPLPGWCRTLSMLSMTIALPAFVLLPVVGLGWVAGGGHTADGWTATFFLAELTKVVRIDGAILAGSCATAVVAGVVTVSLAVVVGWGTMRSRVTVVGAGLVTVTLALTPGPVVGLGLKQLIGAAVDAEAAGFRGVGLASDFPPVRSMVYDQPSPLPTVAACAVRFFPLAFVIVLPAFLGIPHGLRDAARLDGLGVRAAWQNVIGPAVKPAALAAVVAVTALSLGEVSASKLVNPPGRDAAILRLFDQMHYGADTTVAALALLPLVPVAILGMLGGVRRP